MNKECSHCGSKEYVKNGSHKGIQRYKCKSCQRCFSDIPPKFSIHTKHKAVLAYLRGSSMQAVADIFDTCASNVLYWVRSFHKHSLSLIDNAKQQLIKDNEPDVIELDEIYTYCEKNKIEQSYGLLILEGKSVLLTLS